MNIAMLRIQVISDVHLEFRSTVDYKDILMPSAPILILAGDVCPCCEHTFKLLHAFIQWCSKHFEHVFYVPGNHEFYSESNHKNNTMDLIIQRIRAGLKEFKNVYFLYNNLVKFANFCVAGTTLWSDLALNSHREIQQRMSDYSAIHVADSMSKSGVRRLRTADTVQFHKSAVGFIKRCKTIANKNKLPLIVITHHKPTCSAEQCEGISSAYESDLSSLMGYTDTSYLVLWVHGHTHRHNDQRINGTRIYSNAYGYPKEPGTNHIKNATIRLNV